MMTQTKEQKINYGVGERSLNEIIEDLAKDIPAALLKRKPKVKNADPENDKDWITYIPWHQATRLLDFYAPGWEYEIKSVQEIAGKVVLTVALTIVASDCTVTREATGNEDDVTSGYGDPFSNAESMALRRAAAKFGLGRYLYR